MTTFDLVAGLLSTPSVIVLVGLSVLTVLCPAIVVIERRERLHNRKMSLMLAECRRLALENQFLQALAAARTQDGRRMETSVGSTLAMAGREKMTPTLLQSRVSYQGRSAARLPVSLAPVSSLGESTPDRQVEVSALSRYDDAEPVVISIFGALEKTVVAPQSEVDAEWTRQAKGARRKPTGTAAA